MGHHIRLLHGLTILLVVIMTGTVLGEVQRFKQDRFAIGFFVEPPADKKMDQRYKEIAQANFTVVLIANNVNGFASSPEIIPKLLMLCDKYDLKALVSPIEVQPGKIVDGPACWGYIIRDEPYANEFAQ